MTFEMLKRLGRDVSGATAVEYGLILALIFLAMLGAVQAFGEAAIRMWTHVSSEVAGASKP
ncbi:MAG: Flp family type IVb pilin [Tsuneonella sp.]